jgi:hypothetical protein
LAFGAGTPTVFALALFGAGTAHTFARMLQRAIVGPQCALPFFDRTARSFTAFLLLSLLPLRCVRTTPGLVLTLLGIRPTRGLT